MVLLWPRIRFNDAPCSEPADAECTLHGATATADDLGKRDGPGFAAQVRWVAWNRSCVSASSLCSSLDLLRPRSAPPQSRVEGLSGSARAARLSQTSHALERGGLFAMPLDMFGAPGFGKHTRRILSDASRSSALSSAQVAERRDSDAQRADEPSGGHAHQHDAAVAAHPGAGLGRLPGALRVS